jgi:hypothetical protein
LEDVTTAVGTELAKLWPELTIYREDQPNGFVTPCLYLHRLPLQVRPGNIGTRQMRTYSFQVVYFPPEGATNAHELIDSTAERFADCLEVIGGKYRTHNLDVNVEQDTAQVTFDLKLLVAFAGAETKQQHMDYNGGLKNG